MNPFENIIKGLFTSLLGFVAMCAAGYGWWTDYLTDAQGGGLAAVGFVLLFVRDKIGDVIIDFIKSKLGSKPPTP